MNKLESAIKEINLLEEQAEGGGRLHRLPASFKMLLTVWYIFLTVSFGKYDLWGVLSMGVYPLVMFLLYDIPFLQCLKRLKPVFPFLLLTGIVNPVFDRSGAVSLGGILISGGVISMFTLFLKGFFTILAGYLLIVTTGIEKICGVLTGLRLPSALVTVLLLIYRYVGLLLRETNKVSQAYSLRAPQKKGVSFKEWGSFTGLLLLRSMDRAQNVYESMCLRGFEGNSARAFAYTNRQKAGIKDWLWLIFWGLLLFLFRKVPIFLLIGNKVIM